MKKKTSNAGFSLVEMIIAIAILSILISFAVVSLYKYVIRSHQSADVASARSIAKEFEVEYLTNPDFYDQVNKVNSTYDPESGGETYLVAYCGAEDEEWTLGHAFSSDTFIKDYLDENVAPRDIKYRKEIDNLDKFKTVQEATKAAPYSMGGWDPFTPAGWAIAIINGEVCVYVTDGAEPTTGICLSPEMSPCYPGYTL